MSRFRGWFRTKNIKKVRHVDEDANFIHVYLAKKGISFGPYSNPRRRRQDYTDLCEAVYNLRS